jgi:hypothetical protein
VNKKNERRREVKEKKLSYFFKNSLHFSSSFLVHFHLLHFWCLFLNPTKISRETWKKKHTTCGLEMVTYLKLGAP